MSEHIKEIAGVVIMIALMLGLPALFWKRGRQTQAQIAHRDAPPINVRGRIINR